MSKFNNGSFKLDCVEVNAGEDYELCLVEIGTWDIDDIPDGGNYELYTPPGEILFTMLSDYEKKNELLDDESSSIDLLEGEGVVDELRGIRDAILETGKCYKYTGSPIISMAEQTGSAPLPQSSSFLSTENVAGLPPPPSLGNDFGLPPPPPGGQPRKREKTEGELVREKYGNADLTKLSGEEIDHIEKIEPQLFEKLKMLTYKAYRDNNEIRTMLNNTNNIGWLKSNTAVIQQKVENERNPRPSAPGNLLENIMKAAKLRQAKNVN